MTAVDDILNYFKMRQAHEASTLRNDIVSLMEKEKAREGFVSVDRIEKVLKDHNLFRGTRTSIIADLKAVKPAPTLKLSDEARARVKEELDVIEMLGNDNEGMQREDLKVLLDLHDQVHGLTDT